METVDAIDQLCMMLKWEDGAFLTEYTGEFKRKCLIAVIRQVISEGQDEEWAPVIQAHRVKA